MGEKKIAKNISVVLLLTALLGMLGYLGASWFGPDSFVFRDEILKGQQIIARVESFRRKHKQLPTEQEGISIIDKVSPGRGKDSCPCYRQSNKKSYVIWFQGMREGESFLYDSATKKWRREGYKKLSW
jgi:ribosome modulation factor